MTPIISESVYKKIYDLIIKQNNEEVKHLGKEISKAKIVKDSELNKKIVSLYSIVEFINTSLKKSIKMQIVPPNEVDLSKNKISVFAPISVALFGFKENDVFNWDMPSGTKTLKIIRVLNSQL
ncbi:MAG: GreA/GreB family elongation factor [Bacteroidota bacterium]